MSYLAISNTFCAPSCANAGNLPHPHKLLLAFSALSPPNSTRVLAQWLVLKEVRKLTKQTLFILWLAEVHLFLMANHEVSTSHSGPMDSIHFYFAQLLASMVQVWVKSKFPQAIH